MQKSGAYFAAKLDGIRPGKEKRKATTSIFDDDDYDDDPYDEREEDMRIGKKRVCIFKVFASTNQLLPAYFLSYPECCLTESYCSPGLYPYASMITYSVNSVSSTILQLALILPVKVEF